MGNDLFQLSNLLYPQLVAGDIVKISHQFKRVVIAASYPNTGHSIWLRVYRDTLLLLLVLPPDLLHGDAVYQLVLVHQVVLIRKYHYELSFSCLILLNMNNNLKIGISIMTN